MKRPSAVVAFLFLVGAAIGCSSEPVPDPRAELAGTYTLVRINGATLPAQTRRFSPYVMSASMALWADGTAQRVMSTCSAYPSGCFSNAAGMDGSWTIAPDKSLAFVWPSGYSATTAAVVQYNVLVEYWPQDTLEYAR